MSIITRSELRIVVALAFHDSDKVLDDVRDWLPNTERWCSGHFSGEIGEPDGCWRIADRIYDTLPGVTTERIAE